MTDRIRFSQFVADTIDKEEFKQRDDSFSSGWYIIPTSQVAEDYFYFSVRKHWFTKPSVYLTRGLNRAIFLKLSDEDREILIVAWDKAMTIIEGWHKARKAKRIKKEQDALWWP